MWCFIYVSDCPCQRPPAEAAAKPKTRGLRGTLGPGRDGLRAAIRAHPGAARVLTGRKVNNLLDRELRDLAQQLGINVRPFELGRPRTASP